MANTALVSRPALARHQAALDDVDDDLMLQTNGGCSPSALALRESFAEASAGDAPVSPFRTSRIDEGKPG
jgi:hypothetical protein